MMSTTEMTCLKTGRSATMGSRDEAIEAQAKRISSLTEEEIRLQAHMSRAATQLIGNRPALTFVQAETQQSLSRSREVQVAMDVFLGEWISMEMKDLHDHGVFAITEDSLAKHYLSRMVCPGFILSSNGPDLRDEVLKQAITIAKNHGTMELTHALDQVSICREEARPCLWP